MAHSFCVVGIGCSAGGIEVLKEMVGGLPSEQAAYIIAQHLSPNHESRMVDILERLSNLPIIEATQDTIIESGKIYLTPPGSLISIEDNRVCLQKMDPEGTNRSPLHTIDVLFESLAKEYREATIAVVLSGSGNDGVRGARAIKEAGGAIIAQSIQSAQFTSMPNNIISADIADLIADPLEVPEAIRAIIKQVSLGENIFTQEEGSSIFEKIVRLISKNSGVDFFRYRNSTLRRRISKRVGINQLSGLFDYYDFIKKNPEELNIISKEFLIGVTAFFRDKKSFSALHEKAIAPLIKSLEDRDELRIWVPACSSGEEAYTIAMILEEEKSKSSKKFSYRIFATDIDERAISAAQVGQYPAALLHDLPSRYKTRYFNEIDDGVFRVSRHLKDHIVFSKHDITVDPPFGRMNLISFRNCSIYLKKDTQKQVLSILEHSLILQGYLFLGGSETAPKDLELETVDSSAKIYKKIKHRSLHSKFEILKLQNQRLKERPREKRPLQQKDAVLLDISHQVLGEMLPPSVIIDGDGQLHHIFGNITPFAQFHSGVYSGTFYDFLHKDLRSPITLAIKKLENRSPQEDKTIVSKVRGFNNHVDKDLILTIMQVQSKAFHSIYFISFKVLDKNFLNKDESQSDIDLEDVNSLKNELEQSRRDLDFTVENLESTNEELQTTNEELVTSNEELQSTNEELQSVNEELHTMNAEFQDKIEELSQANRDMDILLNVSKVGTLFLDNNLQIRKISQEAMTVMDLREGDIGRSLNHFNQPLYEQFLSDCQSVLNTETPLEHQVQLPGRGWNLIKIHPYSSSDHNSLGLVILIINISELRAVKDSRDWLMRFLLSENEVSFSVDMDGNITQWPISAQDFFGFAKDDIVGKNENVLLPLQSHADIELIHNQVEKGQSAYLQKTYRLTLDEQEIPVTLIAYGKHSEKGKLKGIQYTLFPHTDSEKRKNRLQNELNLTRSYIEHLPIAMLILDFEGRIIYVNEKTCELYKLSQQELYSRTFDSKDWKIKDENRKLLEPEDYTFSQTIQNRRNIENRILYVTKGDGKEIKIEVSGTPIIIDGHTERVLLTIRPV